MVWEPDTPYYNSQKTKGKDLDKISFFIGYLVILKKECEGKGKMDVRNNADFERLDLSPSQRDRRHRSRKLQKKLETRKILFYVSFLIMIVALSTPQIVSASVVDINPYRFSTQTNMARHVVKAANGSLYAVTYKTVGGFYQIVVSTSHDDGLTWNPSVVISTYEWMEFYNQMNPSIDIGTDYIFVVWEGKASEFITDNQIWVSIFNGTGWSIPKRVSTDGTKIDAWAVVAVTSYDYGYISWSGQDASDVKQIYMRTCSPTGTLGTKVRISINYGSPPNVVSFDNQHQNNPTIEMTNNNNYRIAWEGKTNTSGGFLNIYMSRGLTDISKIMDLGNYNVQGPNIALDSNNNIHVVAMSVKDGGGNIQIWYNRIESWGGIRQPFRVSNYAGWGFENNVQINPSVTVDIYNRPHVIWWGKTTNYTADEIIIYRYKDNALNTSSLWYPPFRPDVTDDNTFPTFIFSNHPTSKNNIPDTPIYFLYHDATGADHVEYGNISIPAIPYWPELLNITMIDVENPIERGNWLFEGEIYDIVGYYNNSNIVTLNFTDGYNIINFYYNNGTNKIYVSSENPMVVGGIRYNITRYGNVTRLLWRFNLLKDILDSENVILNYYIQSWQGLNNVGVTGLTFNIYNLGGLVSYDFDGDAGPIVGGSPLEIAHTVSTGTGGYVDVIYRRLQHVHLLYSLDVSDNDCFDIHENTAYVQMGIKYLDVNSSWVDGWFLELSIVNGAVDPAVGVGKAWIVPWISWYGRDENGTVSLIKSDVLSGYPECGDKVSNPITYTRFYVDLWFDKFNYSTIVGGRISTYYYGMDEVGWLLWSNWSPVTFNVSESMFFTDFRDANGNIIHTQDVELMKFWVRVIKAGSGTGEDCDTHQWSIRNPTISYKQADDRMEAVNTPDGIETLVMDMPSTGWAQPVVKAIEAISTAIWKGAFNFIKILWGAMDTFLFWIGLGEGTWTSITTYIVTMVELMVQLISYVSFMSQNAMQIIEDIFSVLILVLPRIVWFLGMWVINIVLMITSVISLFTGGWTNIGDVWNQYSIGEWIELLLIAYWPFWQLERIRASKDPMGQIQLDINMYSSWFYGIYGFFVMTFGLVRSFVGLIIDILPI